MNTEINTSKGSFYKRNGVFYVQATINGKPYKRSTKEKVTNLTKRKFAKKDPCKFMMNLLGMDVVKEKGQMDFEEFGYAYIRTKVKAAGTSTYNDYTRLFKNEILPYFKNFDFEDITVFSVNDFLNTLTFCKDRNDRVKYILYGILETAYDEDLMERNLPSSKVLRNYKFPKTPVNTEAYSVAEVKKMLEQSTGWFNIYLEIALKYGIRPSEMIVIKWDDIDLEKGYLSLKRSFSDKKVVESKDMTNTNKNHLRDFYLFPETIEKLRAYFKVRPHKEWLFVSKDNTHFRGLSSLRDTHMKKLLKRLDIKYKALYGARRSYNSMMSQSNQIQKRDIQNVMGHAEGSEIGDKHYNLDCLEDTNKRAIANRQAEVFNTMLQEVSE